MHDYRAVFDVRVSFVNGGSLSAEGFRLDVPDQNLSEEDVARLLVQHLGLALVGDVRFDRFEIVAEQHKGSRGMNDRSPLPLDTHHRLVDLSHTIREGLVTLPGVPSPVITSHLSREDSVQRYAPGTTFALDVISLPGNTGTYFDTPFHRYEDGSDLSAVELDSVVDLPAEVFHLTDATERGIPASVFYDRDVRGKAVLLHTGWDRHFGTPEYQEHAPFLREDGVDYLAEQGVRLVGIDSINIDDTSAEAGGERPAHTILLAAGIHIVEHLTGLAALPATGAAFTAVPLKVGHFGTSPVRAFAKVPSLSTY
ncbi:MAG: cyclase [Microbacterium sp. 69-10]|uniref:cyclase family protein n=1 Tax=Microbacterium sp. 69-10 TaxID=1895783 RepID=UPI00095F04D8|nr:cyclase family protein [Microbacterium sp. 69-10]OJU41496.1 MAG: cyclase [Microbacterium sp. 69-10]